MAYAKKTFNGPSYGNRKLSVIVEQTAIDIATNKSTLKVTFKSAGNNTGATLFQVYETTIKIDGKQVIHYDLTPWYGTGTSDNPVGVFPAKEGSKSVTTTVTHDSDGTKDITVYFYTGLVNSSSKGNYGGTMTLDTIPRQSTATCANTTLGNAVTINSNRAADIFTHTINIKDGDTVIETLTDVEASVSWTPTIAKYAPYITTTSSKSFTIETTTFNGTTNLGVKTSSVTLTVPDSEKPSATIAISEADTKMKSLGWGIYVKDKSTLNVSITGTAKYNATISGYSSVLQEKTYINQNYVSEVLKSSGTLALVYKVTDSRGYSSDEKTQNITVYDYFNPQLNGVTINRCDANGKEDDGGKYIAYSVNGEIASVNSKNAKTFRIGYKLKGSTADYTWITIGSSYTINTSNTVLSNGTTKIEFSTDDSYSFRVEAIDSFTTTFTTKEVTTGFDIFNLHRSGNSLAIGKISEATDDEKKFEIALETEITGEVKCTKNFTYKGQLLLEYEVLETW